MKTNEKEYKKAVKELLKKIEKEKEIINKIGLGGKLLLVAADHVRQQSH